MGLNQEWAFSDFDEALIKQSSQHLWAKAIIKRRKKALPRILLKYVCHYKWRENLFEVNKIFRYSNGLEELRKDVIPHLTLNKNAIEILNRIRAQKVDNAGILKKMVYRFFPPAINVVIVSSNAGIVIRLFLDREDIRKRFRDDNIVVQAVVANKMRFDENGSVYGLDHEENIIDVNTKKHYIPRINTVLVDKRDSGLRDSHNTVMLVP
jgi:hypothetical protein